MSMIHSLLKEIGHVAFYIYLAEITSPKFRAFFMGLYYFYQASIDEEISAALDERRMNRMLRNCAVLATFTSVFAVFVPETPFWLALKSKSDKAEEIFTWIRAGNSGRSEFNQMLTQAKNIQSKGVMKFIKSRTFAIAMIFTSFIVICAFNPCSVIEVIFNDSYFPEGSTPNEEQMSELNEVMKAPANYLKRNEFYGRYSVLSMMAGYSAKTLRRITLYYSLVRTLPVLVVLGQCWAKYARELFERFSD
ncbi:hypothetical protein V9T40_012262 [Parthenolecanium corni]|uniref:Uncharacterized protein n=1 Tax=Parthenolecanium corni TaxID=536013 RepID=A0AAN9TMU2_9HEMI